MRDTDFNSLLLLMTPQLIKREMKLERLGFISAVKKVYSSGEFDMISKGRLQPFMELVSREEELSIGRREETYLYVLELYRQTRGMSGRELERFFSEHELWEALLESPELVKALSPGRAARTVDAIL